MSSQYSDKVTNRVSALFILTSSFLTHCSGTTCTQSNEALELHTDGVKLAEDHAANGGYAVGYLGTNGVSASEDADLANLEGREVFLPGMNERASEMLPIFQKLLEDKRSRLPIKKKNLNAFSCPDISVKCDIIEYL